ncbi:diaminopimelate decarboxylase [Streptomyces sp. P6-2-1]|uniref:diaminopimelate decarboxylase n=1 Tax=Streptomyces sp. P6-2-1 TaxID=3422591 RepID=UPI003D36AF72
MSEAAPDEGTGGPSGAGGPSEGELRRERAVRAAVVQGIVGEERPLAGLLDVTGIRRTARALKSAFAPLVAEGGPAVRHTFAVRATPLVPVLRLLYEDRIGAEVASAAELALARAAGVQPGHTALDSPTKTVAELREALGSGVLVDVDDAQELERLDALREEAAATSTFGLRVDPHAGEGRRAVFGVALGHEGAREWIVAAFAERPWLTRLHAHSEVKNAGAVPPERLAEGVRKVYELAEEINAAAGRQQVDTLALGGGLAAGAREGDVGDGDGADFTGYAALLKETVPGLFDGRYALVTGFGRSLLAGHGFLLARVEYVRALGGRRLAVTHAGTRIAGPSCGRRLAAYDAQGRPKEGPALAQDLAGPAQFDGELLASGVELPELEQGDWLAVLDTGAYGFARHQAYDSLTRPGIHGFAAAPEGVRFATVRAPQTLAEFVAESGAAHTRALTDDL